MIPGALTAGTAGAERPGNEGQSKKYGFADPPYLGCCSRYNHRHELPWGCWDEPDSHRHLIGQLVEEYPDGWALCLSSPSLATILPMCPADARVCAWTKPFASFKPNVNPAYTWEPVILSGGRKHRDRTEATVRDFVSAPITLKRGLTGAKPELFCRWILDLFGYRGGGHSG